MMMTINILGVLLIAGIAWWFWMPRKESVQAANNGAIEILVENGVYIPARISLAADTKQTLRFLRKDQSPCAAMVQFESLDKTVELPVDTSVEIEVNYPQPGNYSFVCQMGMYRGEITVT